MAKINVAVVDDFIRLQRELPELIRSYGLSVKRICERSGISRATFDRKVKSKRFTAMEMQKICEAIND